MTDLEIRAVVSDLLVRFVHAFDAGEPDRVADLFHHDGFFEAPGGIYAGRRELELMTTAYHRQSADAADTQHWVSMPEVTVVSHDTVTVRSYCHALTCETDTPRVSMMSTYEDLITLREANWRFARRRIIALWPPELRSMVLDVRAAESGP